MMLSESDWKRPINSVKFPEIIACHRKSCQINQDELTFKVLQLKNRFENSGFKYCIFYDKIWFLVDCVIVKAN